MSKKNQIAQARNEIRQVRCNNCGRFLGVGYIEEGIMFIKCKNCKTFTVVLGKRAEENLTGKDMYDILESTGQKVREVQVPT